MKKDIIKSVMQKLYSFFYFMFWGFYFSAGYFFCKKLNNNISLMSVYSTIVYFLKKKKLYIKLLFRAH